MGIPCSMANTKTYDLAGILRTAGFTRTTYCTRVKLSDRFLSPLETARVHGFYNAYMAYNPSPSSSISFWPLSVLTVRMLKDLIAGVTQTFSPCALRVSSR